MGFINSPQQSSFISNDKHSGQHDDQILFKKSINLKYMFCLISGIIVVVTFFLIQSCEQFMSYQKSLHRMNLSCTVLEKQLNVSTVSIAPGVPLVTVGLYYLPLNKPNITRYRAVKENAYGTKDIFGYPMGAHLLSNESEYTIPSDRLFHPNGTREIKYFRESPLQNHMDVRFTNPQHARLPDEERIPILRGLFATWSRFTDENQILYWIAHGTLLSWWWGGAFFPWEVDIDVQMNANFLHVLARFNGTILSGRYLIDVNPNFKIRNQQQHNYIDARLIDKYTGYFIDITGMADIGTRIPSDPGKRLLCDKHVHKTFYSDLHPLVRIEFEGIPSWRPYEAEKCLIQEYSSQSLLKTVYQGYTYNLTNAAWIRNRSLSRNRQNAASYQYWNRYRNHLFKQRPFHMPRAYEKPRKKL